MIHSPAQRPARARNGAAAASQASARNRPAGTPAMMAAENDDITTPVARPRRSSGKASPMMASITAPSTPPQAPAAARAASSAQKSGAAPQPSVARVKPAYSNSRACLRSKRSSHDEAARPDRQALKA